MSRQRMVMIKAFRYSGNKVRHLKYLPSPIGINTILEPYGGSMVWSLNSPKHIRCFGADTNKDIYDLWSWLSAVTPNDLIRLNNDLARLNDKEDLRVFASNHNFPAGALNYLRINVSGVYTGQLSSNVYYKQHSLPIKKTIEAMGEFSRINIFHNDALSFIKSHQNFYGLDTTTQIFLDPPYVKTAGNYISKGANHTTLYNPQETLDIINFAKPFGCKFIFTYGDGAQQLFPGLPWQKLFDRKVPNIRKGGTVNRTEWVCYL